MFQECIRPISVLGLFVVCSLGAPTDAYAQKESRSRTSAGSKIEAERFLKKSSARRQSSHSRNSHRKVRNRSALIPRLEGLLMGRRIQEHVSMSRVQRTRFRNMTRRLTREAQGKGEARGGDKAAFQKMVAERSGPGKGREVDAIVGYVAYSALAKQSKGLDSFLDTLDAKLAKAARRRSTLRCREDVKSVSLSPFMQAAQPCTPQATIKSVKNFGAKVKANEKFSQQAQRALDSGDKKLVEQMAALVAILGPITTGNNHLVKLFLLLQATDPENEPITSALLALYLELANLQSQCDGGNLKACGEIPGVVQKIAQHEAKNAGKK